MPRLLRYLLIWLSCTTTSVTAVMVSVHFVVGSTRPTPPVAQSAPTVFLSSSPSAAAGRSPGPEPSPSSSAKRTTSPKPTRKPVNPRTSAPPPAPRSTPPAQPQPASGPKPGQGCDEGGSGVHTIPSTGGKATVRYGSEAVCLVSAIPNAGFTVSTTQTDAQTLTVTFSAERHRSEITATTVPVDRASVRETSF